MDAVTVAQLKSRLSYYLREVRGGKSYTVLNRDIPVAILAPYEPPELDDLEIIPPTDDATLWGKVAGPPFDKVIDVVALIREDRDDRDDRLDAILREAFKSRRRTNEEQGGHAEGSP